MREVLLHRRAERYLRRMPKARQAQMVAVIEEVAATDEVSRHPRVRSMTGKDGWYRLRVGDYRAVFQPREEGTLEILYVDYIGPRGDAYRE